VVIESGAGVKYEQRQEQPRSNAMRRAWRIFPEVRRRAFSAENHRTRAAERHHTYAACDHSQDDDGEQYMHPTRQTLLRLWRSGNRLRLGVEAPPQTIRRRVKASTARAAGM
jgi:hypothetical protein